MGQTVHLWLKVNGEDVKGESTQTSEGRDGTIECTYFESELMTAREVQSGLATGRRQHKPLLIKKAIDKSTPLIAKALTKNSKISGEFKFFRPNPAGDGTTQHFYTVKIDNGRSTAGEPIRKCVLDALQDLKLTPADKNEGRAQFTWEFKPIYVNDDGTPAATPPS